LSESPALGDAMRGKLPTYRNQAVARAFI